MGKGIFKEKSMSFAVRIVRLYSFLSNDKREFIMSKQLLRSGTAIGALYREAQYAESRKDFIHKLAIAQKECNESLYWIDLLKETDYLNSDQYNSISDECKQLMALVTSIIKTTKERS